MTRTLFLTVYGDVSSLHCIKIVNRLQRVLYCCVAVLLNSVANLCINWICSFFVLFFILETINVFAYQFDTTTTVFQVAIFLQKSLYSHFIVEKRPWSGGRVKNINESSKPSACTSSMAQEAATAVKAQRLEEIAKIRVYLNNTWEMLSNRMTEKKKLIKHLRWDEKLHFN